MRLRRLDLDRFGLFTDRTIELPPAAVDFHLVVGPNEAGKSTLRTAVSELLFGIDSKSSYGFLHGYRELRLGAVLEQASERLELVRLKRNKQPLFTPTGAPLSEGALAPFLGGVDKEFFQRMFGLDFGELTRGGVAILNAQDDVSRMLFEASSGLSGLGELRGRLEEEAKSLWDRRKARDRVYYQALERYEQALEELKAATVRPAQWKRAVEHVDATHSVLRVADEALRGLDLEAACLERIRRVAPHLQKRAELLAHGEEVTVAVELPASAAADLAAASDGIAKAQASIARHAALAEQAQARADGTEVAEALLDARGSIEELEERRAQIREFPAQIQKREAEAAVLLKTVQGIAASLGWSPCSEEVLEGRIPSVVLRAELERLSQNHGGLVEAVRSRAAAVSDLEAELEARRQQLEALPVAAPPAALAERLERALRLGDVEQTLRQVRDKARRARDGFDQVLLQLRPWVGDADALRALELPTPEDVLARLAGTSELETMLTTQKDRSDELRAEIARNRLQIEQLDRGHATVAWDEVWAARRERDALWSRIRGGAETPAAAGDAYEERVVAADGLADRRYLGAETVKEIEQLQKALERQGLDLAELDRRAGAIDGELAAARSDWAALAAGLGLGALPMTQFVAWAARREQALLAQGVHADAASALQELEATVTAEEGALRDALGDLEAERDGLASVGLTELVRRAERAVSSARDARATRERLEREQQQGMEALQRRVRERDEERARLEAWTRRWDELVHEAHLPTSAGVDGVRAAMQALRELETKLRELDHLRRARIATMRRDLDVFEQSCQELVARLAPELADGPAARSARELTRRLAAAAAARDSRQAALNEQREQLQRRRDAEGELARAQRRIQPLLAQAGLTQVGELAAAIQASDHRRRHETELAEATRHAIEGGDGLDLGALEQEVAGADLVALSPRLGDLARKRREAEASREKLLIEHSEAKAALDRVAGQADAASAAARSEEALADMAAAVERYLKVQVAARLLRWAIDRHRDEREAPLLRRASELFARLTRGSFLRLSVDHEHRPPQLVGLRADSKHTLVNGMSDATRDQLFLALRIAAVELHLERGHALPFIADDLFINYDDGRAAAGLELLAGLARKTQVIFLTHHEHLLPIARDVFGEPLNVVSL